MNSLEQQNEIKTNNNPPIINGQPPSAFGIFYSCPGGPPAAISCPRYAHGALVQTSPNGALEDAMNLSANFSNSHYAIRPGIAVVLVTIYFPFLFATYLHFCFYLYFNFIYFPRTPLYIILNISYIYLSI